jgi:hypothetical protein
MERELPRVEPMVRLIERIASAKAEDGASSCVPNMVASQEMLFGSWVLAGGRSRGRRVRERVVFSKGTIARHSVPRTELICDVVRKT